MINLSIKSWFKQFQFPFSTNNQFIMNPGSVRIRALKGQNRTYCWWM